jgi:hypothetical protein
MAAQDTSFSSTGFRNKTAELMMTKICSQYFLSLFDFTPMRLKGIFFSSPLDCVFGKKITHTNPSSN